MTATRTLHRLATPDGPADLHLAHPAGAGPWPGVVFFMDGVGIRPDLFDMADRLAERGYVVALPDLFHRAGPYEPLDMARVFSPGPERDRLMKLITGVSNASLTTDTRAVIDFLGTHAAVKPGALGCTGYCMGGRAALLAAGRFGDRFAAAASFHGGGLITDKPDSPHLLASRITAELYIGVAGIDQHFSDADREHLDRALTAAGVTHTIEVYPGAHHGFAMNNSPVYDREAAERHWDRLFALLGRTLG